MVSKRTIVTGLLIIVAAMALLLAAAAPALAGLRVTGAKVQATLAPGESGGYVINVANSNAEGGMDVAIDIMGMGNYLSGGAMALQPSEDLSQYTARGYVSASPSSFHLEPGQSQDVTVNATLPADAGDGGRYAVVYIYTVPNGSGMQTSAAVASQLLITIENSNLVISGDLTSLELAPPQSQQAFSASATVHNTGNYHYKLSFNGTVTNSGGETVGAALQTDSIYTVIPTFSQNVQIPFNIYSDLPPGIYNLEIRAYSDGGIFLDNDTLQFILNDTYKPAPVRTLKVQLWDTAASWAMSEDGVLLEDVNAASLDSTVSIFLQSGTTVLGPDSLPLETMNISRMDPPPSPPIDYEMISAFRFEPDGATFDPEARFTVKYTQSDIPKGVKENQLEIATLNTSTLQWQILNSDVNAGANTITFSTGHLSVYALISPPASASAGIWLWIIIGLAIVAVLALIIFIYKRRQDKKAARKKAKSRRAPKAGARQEADDR